jgi:hypothetical protein
VKTATDTTFQIRDDEFGLTLIDAYTGRGALALFLAGKLAFEAPGRGRLRP